VCRHLIDRVEAAVIDLLVAAFFVKVYDLDDKEELRQFLKGEQRQLKIYNSEIEVTYDPQKRIGVALSKIGANKAVSLGAYAFALHQLSR
jgi:hypothetical protein